MRRLFFIFGFVMFICTLGAHESRAQTNAELSTAIGGGPTDIQNFFNTYASNPTALANLDPNLLNQALSGSNGGLGNLTSALTDNQIGSLINGLSSNGPLGANLSAALINDIGTNLSFTQAQSILDGITSNTLGAIEAASPGALSTLTSAIPNLDTMLSSVTGGDLGNFLSLASGGAGSVSLGGFTFSTDGAGGFSISIPGLGTFNFGGGLGGIFGGGGSIPGLGGVLGGGSGGGGITEDPALPTAAPLSATCNSDMMVNIETRAWLEAQREVTQNANLIAKPDSVMEYTCFDQYLNVLAQQADNIFSDNLSAWSSTPGSPASTSGMDNALTALVGGSLGQYLSTNFGHNLIGGRATFNATVSASISGGSYTCDVMQRVWQEAKCQNFAMRANDGFLTFQQHASTEVRDLAGSCSGSVRYPGYLAEFTNPTWRTTGGALNYNTVVAADFEEVRMFTAPLGSPLVPNCAGPSRAIVTGLSIGNGTATPDPDKICLNPGCYVNTAGNCVPI